jgi:hypothetical protein
MFKPIVAATAATLLGCGVAHADPVRLTADETEFAKSTADLTCQKFAANPTPAGFTSIVAGIVASGYTSSRAGYIMGYQITTTCPSEEPAVERAANAINDQAPPAPKAMADTDREFLARQHAAGYVFGDPAEQVALAHRVCIWYQEGESDAQVYQQLETSGQQAGALKQAAQFAANVVLTYPDCTFSPHGSY